LARTAIPLTAPPQLEVHLRHRIGALTLEVDFTLTQQWTILFGPSGSGKTTILRAIAGLLRPDWARILIAGIDGQNQGRKGTYVDTDARRFVPSHQRHVPLAAQSASLFPNMTVRRQVAYGISLAPNEAVHAGSMLKQRDDKTEAILALFRIEHLAGKLPGALSGGEGQRVNLARATASASRLLLLDEPFTGLDLALRSELMQTLRAYAAQENLCVLSVTHGIAEAFQLDAEIIKLADGRIVQQGPVATVLADERARLLQQLTPSE
jgi:molybdate transport system ATP-binding protein